MTTSKSQSNSAMLASSLAKRGSDLDSKGHLTVANGLNCMAASIMAFHRDMESNNRPSLSAMRDRGEAYSVFKSAFQEHLIAEKSMVPHMGAKAAKVSILAQEENNARNHRSMVLIAQGFTFASVLDVCGISLASFSVESGYFSVPLSALIPENGKPNASHRKASDANPASAITVALDGKPFIYLIENGDGENVGVRKNATYEALVGFTGQTRAAKVTAAAKNKAAGQIAASEQRADTASNSLAEANEAKAILQAQLKVATAGAVVAEAAERGADSKRNEAPSLAVVASAALKAMQSLIDLLDEQNAEADVEGEEYELSLDDLRPAERNALTALGLIYNRAVAHTIARVSKEAVAA